MKPVFKDGVWPVVLTPFREDGGLDMTAYRALLEALKREIPGLVISMDVTRNSRPNFDFALDYGRLFLENRGRNIPDHRYYHPYMALGNLWYTLKYAPVSHCEIEMMPQATDYPLEYILGTTIFASPLYWGNRQYPGGASGGNESVL